MKIKMQIHVMPDPELETIDLNITCHFCGTPGQVDVNVCDLTPYGDGLKGTLEFEHTCLPSLEEALKGTLPP